MIREEAPLRIELVGMARRKMVRLFVVWLYGVVVIGGGSELVRLEALTGNINFERESRKTVFQCTRRYGAMVCRC